MKKVLESFLKNKKLLFIVICVLCATIIAVSLGITLLNKKPSKNDKTFAFDSGEKLNYLSAMSLTDYASDVKNQSELEMFDKQGKSNSSYKSGIKKSYFYQTEINGEKVDTYMIPTAETSPHSVVYLDVSPEKLASGITIKVTANYDVEKAIVLPEKRGLTPEISQNLITFTVEEYNNYTLITNDERNPDKPFTIYVRRPERVQVPYGYTLIEYKPGLHFVDKIDIKSNTVLYLHAGALVVATDPNNTTEQSTGVDSFGCKTYRPFIYGTGAENVKIMGHGVIDLSQLPWHARSGLKLDACKNVEVNGITVLNSATWTMTYMYCENLTIEDCVIFGYRTNSDAYAICSCKDTVVKNSFARSGDDLFEVKTYGGATSENVLFENNVAWPDNCRGFGVTQETHSNINNITYRDCSLLYQLKNWSEHMASYVITAGEPGNVTNVLFENCDLFYSEVYALRFSVGENAESNYKAFNNKITGVTFKNCNFKEGRMKVRNVTSDSKGISNIVFENFTWGGSKLTADNPITFDIEGNGCEIIYK